jgi:hypothetical protein
MTESSEQFRERMRREIKPVALRGFLGWGNRKGGYEAYGPGGRWDNVDPDGGVKPRTNPNGDLLGDALERAGAHEGATLLVIAVDRFGDTSVLDEVERLINGAAS